jgi:cytochrome b561
MVAGDDSSMWGRVTRTFHWGLGAAILGMIAYGWWMNHVPARPDRFFYRSIHADIGYALLLLMALRLCWRLVNPVPALPYETPQWQRLAARVSHGALYGFTMLVALLGWAHSGAHQPDYADWFGLLRVPQFTSPDKAAAHLYQDWHITVAYVLLALVAIHVAAALYHHFIRRDGVTARMIGQWSRAPAADMAE